MLPDREHYVTQISFCTLEEGEKKQENDGKQ